jgi:hypothetical protein
MPVLSFFKEILVAKKEYAIFCFEKETSHDPNNAVTHKIKIIKSRPGFLFSFFFLLLFHFFKKNKKPKKKQKNIFFYTIVHPPFLLLLEMNLSSMLNEPSDPRDDFKKETNVNN